MNTSPTDFLERMKETLIIFFKEKPQHKIQITLMCVMQKVYSSTGRILAEEHVPFHLKQESVSTSTDLEELFKTMKTKILESFSTYIKNGSGWTLKSVVKLEITTSNLIPLK